MLTNADLTWREVLPGAVTAAIILEATFQFLPVYVDISKHNPVLQTLSGPAILLVWLYVMANVIVLGAEVNWWRAGTGAAGGRSGVRATAGLRALGMKRPIDAGLIAVRNAFEAFVTQRTRRNCRWRL